jgi:hypothetical protein
MTSVSKAAIAAALALSAVAALPALAQTDPYGGQPAPGGYQGGPPPQNGGQGGYPGGAPGAQGYGPEGYGPQGPGPQGYGGRNMRNLTLQQFQARQVANLMKMDTDHDGRVSLAEWTAWHEAHPGRGGGPVDPARSFARIDVNRDGYITQDEMSAMAATRYARMQGGAPGMGPGGGNPPPQPLGPQ